MERKTGHFLAKTLVCAEYMIACVIFICVLLDTVGLVASMGIFHGKPFDTGGFSAFLSGAFTLVIGIEFIRMLTKHTPSSVIEVLLFSIARQMVVEHVGPVETLIGVVAIAGVFAIRKYLFVVDFHDVNS